MKTRFVPMLAVGLLALPTPLTLQAEQPKLSTEEFRAKLKQDTAALPASGQLQLSYAPVVEKVLPTVVRVTTYSNKDPHNMFGGGGGRSRDQMDMMREWFRQFGMPVPEDDPRFNPGDDDEKPKRKKNRDTDEQEDDEAQARQKAGVGSGVIISTDGYILTNNHVVENSDRLEVIVGNNTKAYKAKIIGTDVLTDVALIKIEGENFPVATLGNSDNLKVGDIVLAAGSPMELSQSVSQGIVSAMGRTGVGIVGNHGFSRKDNSPGFENFIQTDAAINPGNSGGPLVDGLGRVVGINTAIFTRSGMSAGIGFSIPINMALRIAEDLADDGQIKRGFLGVQMAMLSPEEARDVGLDDGGGVMVSKVTENSPAQTAGIEPMDIIISANGQRTESPPALRSIVGSARVGTSMPIEIIRDGQRKTISVTLKGVTDKELAGGLTPTEDEKEEKETVAQAPAAKPDVIIDGVTCADITPGLRQRYDIPEDVSGAVVVKLEPNTPAARAGLEEGDVILSINQKAIKNLTDAKANKPQKNAAMLKINRAGEVIGLMVREE
jgi:serine protease Do